MLHFFRRLEEQLVAILARARDVVEIRGWSAHLHRAALAMHELPYHLDAFDRSEFVRCGRRVHCGYDFPPRCRVGQSLGSVGSCQLVAVLVVDRPLGDNSSFDQAVDGLGDCLWRQSGNTYDGVLRNPPPAHVVASPGTVEVCNDRHFIQRVPCYREVSLVDELGRHADRLLVALDGSRGFHASTNRHGRPRDVRCKIPSIRPGPPYDPWDSSRMKTPGPCPGDGFGKFVRAR